MVFSIKGAFLRSFPKRGGFGVDHVDEFFTALLGHLDFGADGDKVLYGGMTRSVDRCGMFAIISLGA